MEDKEGQAVVEMAIVLPLLILLLLGIIDFGRALYTKHSLTNAARSGARTAAVTAPLAAEPTALLSSSDSTIARAVKHSLTSVAFDSVSYELKILNNTGTPITVPVHADSVVQVTLSFPNFPMMGPYSPTLTAKASMPYE